MASHTTGLEGRRPLASPVLRGAILSPPTFTLDPSLRTRLNSCGWDKPAPGILQSRFREGRGEGGED
eukprot:6047616-Pyramimonas_sp.AAC.1